MNEKSIERILKHKEAVDKLAREMRTPIYYFLKDQDKLTNHEKLQKYLIVSRAICSVFSAHFQPSVTVAENKIIEGYEQLNETEND